ncbi:MAG: GNAT family N-acetyltransferase [Rhodobacteraceae bacterium]|jgi:GNAT superfamily N-acetyltransferase|nr:GNAT family N-acetyltransferase [Paracoccaceae bacterium]
MTDAPDLRAPAAADRAAWEDLWSRYLAFYDTRLPGAVHDATFARLLAPGPDGPFGLIAWQGGRPVGLVHWLYHLHCWRIDRACYLQDLFVDEAARGGGVGRALIGAVCAAADAAGAPGVYWLTQENNTRARALYDRVARLTPFVRYVRA